MGRRGSSKVTRSALMVVVVLLLGVLGIGLYRAHRQKANRNPSAIDSMEAAMRLTNMEYTEMKDGRRLWTLRSKDARYFRNGQRTLLSEVKLVLFLQNGRTIKLRSDNGTLFAGSKDIELWGSVTATMPEGYRVTTERLRYTHKKGEVFSETPIAMKGPELELRGGQWSYDIKAERAVLKGGIEATITSEGLAGQASSRLGST